MRAIEFTLRNPAFMALVLLLMGALGYSAWTNIPRSEDPYFDSASFRITAVYPGAEALAIEQEIAEPIEDRINELDDLEELESTSRDGVMQMRVQFYANVDADRKYDELVREVNALIPQLPQGLRTLEVERRDPSRVNIVQLALVSDAASWGHLADLAEDLEERLETIGSIRDAQTWGYPQRELRVALNLDRLAQVGLRADSLLEAIRADNQNLPAGTVDVGSRRLNLKTSGSFASPDELASTVVASADGRVLRLTDVAEVGWAYQPETELARYDGQRAVFVTAQQKPNRNIFTTQAEIERVLGNFRRTLPADVKLELGFRQATNVANRLSRLNNDFLIAIGLVGITLLPLGLRAAGVVMVSIPLSLAMGLAALHALGFSLNQLSIAGFVVALGLLVDDAIVVVENITRHLREGRSRRRAALLATQQIARAVLGCTATLLLAFVPLLALPGNSGKFIRSLPAAVTLTVLASLLVALLIIPFVASRVLERESRAEGNRVLQALMKVIHRVYTPMLQRALAHPKSTLALSAVLVVLSFALVPFIGLSVFPKADTPQLLVQIELPDGSSLERTDTVLREVERDLLSRPEVAHVMTSLGRGNPRIYYNISQHEVDASYAELFVQIKDYDPAVTPRVYDEWRRRYAEIPGVHIVVKEFENGPGVTAPIALRVIGPDLRELRRLAGEIEGVLYGMRGTANVVNPLRSSRMDLQLKVDADRAALSGVSPPALDRMAQMAVSGAVAGVFHREDGNSYPVVLRTPMAERANLTALNSLHVANDRGGQVPLGQLAQPMLVESTPSIDRFMRERSVEVTAYVQSGYNVQSLTNQVVAEIRGRVKLPDGYRLHIGGEVESSEESFSGFGTAVILACGGILAVLVLEFGSWKSTLIVASVVPLGVMGGLVALLLSGYTLSFTAMIGFIALIGIEIKNSILLVDSTNQLRREGMALDAAIARAGEIRFLPILLTSATAVGGLLPLALQHSGLYSPLAWVIIGGLISSTLIGRLVTPVMYKSLPPRLSGRGTTT